MVEEELIASLHAGREEALIFLYDNYSAVLHLRKVFNFDYS